MWMFLCTRANGVIESKRVKRKRKKENFVLEKASPSGKEGTRLELFKFLHIENNPNYMTFYDSGPVRFWLM